MIKITILLLVILPGLVLSQNWTKVENMKPFVHHVFVSKTNPNSVIVASDSIPMEHSSQEPFNYFELLTGSGIQLSSDGGKTFDAYNDLDSVFVSSIFESSNGDILISYLDKGRAKVTISKDGGKTWDKNLSSCDLASQILGFIQVDNRIFAGAINSNNGLVYSDDNFESCIENDLSVSVRDIHLSSNGTIYLAGDDQGLEGVYWSSNNGETWEKDQSGIEDLRIHCVWTSPIYDGVVLCGADKVDPLTKEVSGKGIFISYDSGATWTNTAASTFPVYKIAHHPKYPLFLAAAIGKGGVIISSDGGVNWEEVNSGLPQDFDVRYLTIPNKDKLDGGFQIFAGIYNEGLYLSKNINPSLVSIENSEENKVKIIPNPVVDIATVEFFASESSIYKIEIFNLLGNSFYSNAKFIESGNNTIQIPELNLSGMYLLKISSENEEITTKILYQN